MGITKMETQFLTQYMPFSILKEEELQILTRNASTQSFKQGKTILHASDPPSKYLYVVYQGLVVLYRDSDVLLHVGPGETFGSISVTTSTPVRVDIIADVDSTCVLIPRKDFLRVVDSNRRFSRYFVNLMERRLISLYKLASKEIVGIPERYLTNTKIGEIISREPVTCSQTNSIREAIKTMHRGAVGSIVIVDETKKPLGILTLKDLTNIISRGDDLDKPISTVMSTPVIHIAEDATLYDAYLTEISNAISHLVLVDNESQVKGVITIRDLLVALNPTYSLSTLSKRITGVSSVGELKKMHERTIGIIIALLNRGVSYHELAQTISVVNDMITRKAIALAEAKLVSGKLWRPVRYVWVVAGSGARREQVLQTDQDNGIIYDDSTDDKGKELIAELATSVTNILEELGIPKCKAGYMASNPMWAKSLKDWMAYFDTWFEKLKDSLNRAHLAVFLDFRPVYGDESLANLLKTYVFEREAGDFPRILANAAISVPSPFTFLDKVKYGKNGLDIKHHGLLPVVSGIKALMLDKGIIADDTITRIDILTKREILPPTIGEPLKEAFHFFSMIRLKHQLRQFQLGLVPDSYIKSSELHRIEKANLRECLKTMRSFQEHLKLKYALGAEYTGFPF